MNILKSINGIAISKWLVAIAVPVHRLSR